MMKSRKILAAAMSLATAFGSLALAAGTTDINDDSSLYIGYGNGENKTGQATESSAVVDARAGASVLITPKASGDDNPYTAGHPTNLGKNNDGTYQTDVARVVVHNTRTDLGLNTNASRTGTAIGAFATAKGSDATALGHDASVNQANGLALGANSQVTAQNSVALGAGSEASEANTVSVGSASQQRRITNVANGQQASDAATMGQVEALTGANSAAIQANTNSIHRLDARVNDLGTEIDQVGAISAALAGLHPLYTDKGFELSAAAGAYDGKQAMALGGFYHANPDVLLSFGAATSFGNEHKTAGNVGVTFRVGPKSESLSTPAASADVLQALQAMNKRIDSLTAENQKLKEKIDTLTKK